MNETLSISAQGLRLIKAFEGFRPVDRELVSGARVVGYGHKLSDDRAMRVTREEAHELLVSDLAPFEDMLNEQVHAAISQAQFDALASLAFNIGPRAFQDSDVLRAVNAGRPLEAAHAFDAWRLAEIGGRRFVVDALVRRRTAEKALFLRPPEDGLAPKAPSVDLDVEADDTLWVDQSDLDVLDRDTAGQLVSDAPYDIERLIAAAPLRRRDDQRTGDMAWSEVDGDMPETEDGPASIFDSLEAVFPEQDDDDSAEDATHDEPSVEAETPRSLIADAADEVRDRLTALMETDEARTPARDASEDWPESLIQPLRNDVAANDLAETVEREESKVLTFPSESAVVKDTLPALSTTDDDLVDVDADEDATRAGPKTNWVYDQQGQRPESESLWPYALIMIVGGALFGTGAALILRGVETVFGFSGDMVSIGMTLLGAMILLGGLIYLLKAMISDGV